MQLQCSRCDAVATVPSRVHRFLHLIGVAPLMWRSVRIWWSRCSDSSSPRRMSKCDAYLARTLTCSSGSGTYTQIHETEQSTNQSVIPSLVSLVCQSDYPETSCLSECAQTDRQTDRQRQTERNVDAPRSTGCCDCSVFVTCVTSFPSASELMKQSSWTPSILVYSSREWHQSQSVAAAVVSYLALYAPRNHESKSKSEMPDVRRMHFVLPLGVTNAAVDRRAVWVLHLQSTTAPSMR